MRLTMAWMVLAATLPGCGCEEPVTRRAAGELLVVEAALDFGPACPPPLGQPEAGQTLTRSVHLRNVGAASLYLNRFEVDEAHRGLFFFDPSQVPEQIAAGGEVEIVVTFRPAAVGPVEGSLTIQGDEEERAPTVLPLRGAGRDLAPRPVLSLGCPGGKFPTADLCQGPTPMLLFADTPVRSTTPMALWLTNQGCPPLWASDFAVTLPEGAEAGTFSVAAGQPALAMAPGGGDPVRVEIWFRPPQESTFDGELSFRTNDPDRPRVTLPLAGTGTAPVLTLDPAVCDFSQKTPCGGVFTVGNAGALPLKVQAVLIKHRSPLFAVRKSLAGTTLPVGGSDTVEVDYLPGFQRGSDLLVVESDGGNGTAALLGGSPPVVGLQPELFLDFGSGLSTTLDYYRPITISNLDVWNRQLDLTVRAVEIDARPPSNVSQTFALKADPTAAATCPPAPAPGTKLPPGGSLKACVHFRSASHGGTFGANLLVRTDDPTRPDPDGYLLSVGASTGCNRAPDAQITWPQGRACPCAGGNEACVSGACHRTGSAQLPAGAGSITLSGAASFDRVDDGTGACTKEDRTAVAFWEWSLDARPGGSAAGLSPEGRTATSATTLSLDLQGSYAVRLVVYDRSGLPSPPTTFAITATP